MEHLNEIAAAFRQASIPCAAREPLSRHTSFQIGGPAALFCEPQNKRQLARAVAVCRQAGVRYYLLGKGTNILFADEGFDGVVIHIGEMLGNIECNGLSVTAQAGAALSKVCIAAANEGLSGLEFAYGIPGCVGGAVYMNAGAYGGEMCQVVTGVTAMDRAGNLLDIPADKLDLSYRHSRFMNEDLVILSVRVKLEKGDREEIRAKMAELMTRRRTSQPLELPSAGSTFKRPATGYAAAMIEAAGLKGLRVGDAQVSEKHAGFVVNRGRATCKDVLQLMEQVQDRVEQDTGVRLEPEVRILEVQRPCAF